MTDASGSSSAASPPPGEDRPRRGFLVRFLAVLIGGFVALAPVLPGLAVLLDPLRKRQGGAGGGRRIRVARLDAVPDDGVPRQFPVIADEVDGWNRTADQPIGSVYLRRLPGSDKVEALNAICPHAGCFIAVIETAQGKRLGCPCHTSVFDLSGEMLSGVSPRAMDPLTVDEQALAESGEVWIEFQNFHTGRHDRVVKT